MASEVIGFGLIGAGNLATAGACMDDMFGATPDRAAAISAQVRRNAAHQQAHERLHSGVLQQLHSSTACRVCPTGASTVHQCCSVFACGS